MRDRAYAAAPGLDSRCHATGRAPGFAPRYDGAMMLDAAGVWMVWYGAFLLAAGGVGYLTNPERAVSALVSGTVFGALSIAWAVLLRRGVGWAPAAALVSTSVLAAVFGWRGSRAWMLVARGHEYKLPAAVIITAMLLASLVMIGILLGAVLARGRGAAA